MLIQPRVRGFICTTAHPHGCFKVVAEQVDYVKKKDFFSGSKPKNVLVIGASTGYGLASRILAAFGCHAKTIGVFFERPADEKRTASPGWYNTAAFEKLAHEDNLYAKSINGDAFSAEIKQQTADLIRQDLKKVDLIVYSLAAPRRTHSESGQTFSSVLKPIGAVFTSKTVDAFQGEVKEVTIEPATPEEITHTIDVMGGDDWEQWIDFLAQENLLAEGAKTIAYSYIGPELTYPIYKEGTIGKAKEDLYASAQKINKKLATLHGCAVISVNKALVTQASAAIPVVPLYISLLYKIMKDNKTHEGCIEQIYRLFHDFLYSSSTQLSAQEFIRLDDLEMVPEVQTLIAARWPLVTSQNLAELSDIAGYRDEFYRLFGFGIKSIDYQVEVDPHVSIESIS